MRILVTGSDGFIGKNLVESLKNIRDGKDLRHMIRKCAIPAHLEIMECTGDSPDELLDRYCKTADFVFCLAGTNRSQQAEAFIEGNTKSVAKVLELLKRHGRNTTVMYASSIQASLTGRYEGSFYGESKKQGEDLVRRYGEETGAATLIYRFVNVFGKWCRPDCHSVIATFCSHIAREEPIRVDDPKTQLRLIYIDDLIEELLQALDGRPSGSESGYAMVKPEYQASIEEIVALLYRFHDIRQGGCLPSLEEQSFEKKLYATYISYLPQEDLLYPLMTHMDERGSFTELIRTMTGGQFSVNITRPGITKGGHWHHTKTEKFVVVSGRARIQLKKIVANADGQSDAAIDYHVSGEKIEVVDIPPGYLHAITNEGDRDLITLMWCDECFDQEKPDTFCR